MKKNRSYISPYDLEGANPGSSDDSGSHFHGRPKQGNLLPLKVLIVLLVVAYAAFSIYQENPEKFLEFKESLLSGSDNEQGHDEEHEDEGNIMILGPPWVYMKDGVNDMPVMDEDITFLWLVRGSSGETIRNMMTDCLDLRLQNYHHGIDVEPEMSSLSRTNGLASPNIREVAAKFNANYYGRMFAFFRHPYQIFKESIMRETVENPLIRTIIGEPEMKITYKELGIAKKVVREKCIVGLLDEHFDRSIKRIVDYFGWVEKDGMGESCFEKHRSKIPKDVYGDMMADSSPEWQEFMLKNRYDLQLYEFARSVHRAHAQTIIPRYKQLAALEDEEEDEDEEEGDSEEEE